MKYGMFEMKGCFGAELVDPVISISNSTVISSGVAQGMVIEYNTKFLNRDYALDDLYGFYRPDSRIRMEDRSLWRHLVTVCRSGVTLFDKEGTCIPLCKTINTIGSYEIGERLASGYISLRDLPDTGPWDLTFLNDLVRTDTLVVGKYMGNRKRKVHVDERIVAWLIEHGVCNDASTHCTFRLYETTHGSRFMLLMDCFPGNCDPTNPHYSSRPFNVYIYY